jgi:hypothetical protein
MSLVSDSESLSGPSPVASVYIALLLSIIDHPTGFEKYHLAPSHHLEKVKNTHPSLYYRHKILSAYNLGICLEISIIANRKSRISSHQK